MSSLSNLLIQENEHYQLILSKFLNSLDNLDLFPKSRKSYFIPYNTLLPLLEETELLNNIHKSKTKKDEEKKEFLRKQLINILHEKHNVLSSILETQINQHNVRFTRVLDRFESFSPNIKTKTITDVPKKKKKVRFEKDEETKSNNTHSNTITTELPVFAKILLQSNNYSKFTVQHQPFTFTIKDNGDQTEKILSIIYHLIFHQIYNCRLRIIKKETVDTVKQKEFETELYNCMGIDSARNIEHVVEYLECVKNAINFSSDFYLINIPLWDSCLSSFIHSSKTTSDENFCKTTIFKSMYKTWFPWCKSPKEFLELIRISKRIRHLNPIWYNTVFENDVSSLSKKMSIQDLFIVHKWTSLSITERLYICLYAKMFGDYILDYSIFPQFNQIVKQYSHDINHPLDIMKSFFNVSILSNSEKIFHSCINDNCLWNIILVKEQENYTIISLTDEDEVIHVAKPVDNTYSLLNNINIAHYDKEFINRWSNLFWPSWDEIKHSYMNHNYIMHPIIKNPQNFCVADKFNIPIMNGNDVEAYRKAFSILRAWPEVNYEQLSLGDLAKNGYITNIKDIIKLLILEKKLFFWISNTTTNPWIYEVDSGFKSKYDDSLLRCSTVYSLEKGWNNISPLLTINHIEEFNIDPETACYIYIRLNDLFNVKGISRNIYVSKYIKLFKQPTISKRIADINYSSLINCPLLSLKSFDVQFFDKIIYSQINGLISSDLYNKNQEFIIKAEEDAYYSVERKQHISNSTFNSRQDRNLQTNRPLPYPVILKEETVKRLGFYGCEGDATKHIGGGRFIITMHKGYRTAKLCPVKDFQWNDARYIEDSKTNEEFEEKKDKYLPSLQADSSGDNLQKYRVNKTHYYKPNSLDKDFRATYYELFHPYSKNSIIPFIDFLNISIDSELQDAFYQFVTSSCLNGNCILYRFCHLLWDIYVKHNIPLELTYLNREIRFDYRHFMEKIKSFDIVVGQELSNETFNIIMKNVYKKQKWHCVIFSPISNFKEFK